MRKKTGTIVKTKLGLWQAVVTMPDGSRKRLPPDESFDAARKRAQEASTLQGKKVGRPRTGHMEFRNGSWHVRSQGIEDHRWLDLKTDNEFVAEAKKSVLLAEGSVRKGPPRTGSIYKTKSGYRARLRLDVDGNIEQRSFDLGTQLEGVALSRLRELVKYPPIPRPKRDGATTRHVPAKLRWVSDRWFCVLRSPSGEQQVDLKTDDESAAHERVAQLLRGGEFKLQQAGTCDVFGVTLSEVELADLLAMSGKRLRAEVKRIESKRQPTS